MNSTHKILSGEWRKESEANIAQMQSLRDRILGADSKAAEEAAKIYIAGKIPGIV